MTIARGWIQTENSPFTLLLTLVVGVGGGLGGYLASSWVLTSRQRHRVTSGCRSTTQPTKLSTVILF